MPVLDADFVVSEIMQVPAGAALRGFPDFPKSGTLLILSPPHPVGATELNALAADVSTGTGVDRLVYRFWQLNADHQIGLLCDKFDESTIPLGSRVKFVRRRKK